VGDLLTYFVQRPPVPTLVRFSNPVQRDDYLARIRQRVGLGVERFAILNVHRIGIDAPLMLVWQKSLEWGPDSTYWPMRIAPMERPDGSNHWLEVYLFGRAGPHIGTGPVGHDASLADSSPGPDPPVICFDHFFEVAIREDLLGDVVSDRGDCCAAFTHGSLRVPS
jgi:hypothetical protein